jgi:hypothetical protein
MNEKLVGLVEVIVIAGVVYLIAKALFENYESFELVLLKDVGIGFRASRAPRLDESSGESLMLQGS